MRIGVTINLGNYESIRYDSNDLPTDVECAKELIKKLSKHKHMEVESFIKAYLFPVIMDKEKDLKAYKKILGIRS